MLEPEHCRDPDELESYAVGDLPEAEHAEVEKHLEECPECRELLEEIEANLEVAGPIGQLLASVETPESLGPFRILREIGQGGMGVVFLAEQERPRRRVALKMIRPGSGSPVSLRRFEHEANLLGQLQHPGIAQIHEAGVVEGRPYLAMEYVDGTRLDDWVRERSPATRDRLALLARICDAVHHAHVHGVVHRDLKPGNVMVVESGGDEGARPKVLDFGVARATDVDLQTLSLSTQAGQILGTVPFMSPEQVVGDSARIDARSDVYSLGVLAHWLLSGDLPYSLAGRSIAEAARIIQDEDPSSLSSADARLRGDVETIVGKALEKDPERRYQSASEMAADVRRHLSDQPIVARPPSAKYQLSKFARRNRQLVAAAVVVLVVLVSAAVGGSWLAIRATNAEREAREQLARAETEGAKQEAINAFLQGMLSSANPFREGSQETTVLEVLDAAVAELDEGELADQPELEFAVRESLGNTYWASARYEEAERQLREAIRILEDELPELVEKSVKIWNDLGLLCAETGRYPEAEEIFREQNERAAKHLGPDHVRTGRCLSNLAGVLADQGELEEAGETLTRALEISADFTEDDRKFHVANLRTLAGIRFFSGDYEGAEEIFRETTRLTEEMYGAEHPQMLPELASLGVVLKKRQDYEAAVAVHRRELELSRKLFGEKHPNVASSLNNLAMSLFRSGQTEDVEALLRESLAMNRELLGDDHRETGRGLNDLAQVLRKEGRLEEAEPLYRESLGIYGDVYGPDHPSVATISGNLGQLLAAQGRFEEAEALLEAALRIQLTHYGEDDEQTVASRQALEEMRRMASSEG